MQIKGVMNSLLHAGFSALKLNTVHQLPRCHFYGSTGQNLNENNVILMHAPSQAKKA